MLGEIGIVLIQLRFFDQVQLGFLTKVFMKHGFALRQFLLTLGDRLAGKCSTCQRRYQ